jgi:hypothetical protein
LVDGTSIACDEPLFVGGLLSLLPTGDALGKSLCHGAHLDFDNPRFW